MIDDPGCYDAGIPRGSAGLALRLAGRAAGIASRLTGETYEVDEHAVLAHLLLPLVTGEQVAPAAPRPAAGGGWVHTDLIPDDEELFDLLVSGAPDADAEAISTLAQECRLPVTPYRGHAAWVSDVMVDIEAPLRRVEPADVTVVDMTAMWAGPLCTMLLAAWGARVFTVEPESRPDGLRGSPAQFAVLDQGKARRPWDLRERGDREAFEEMIAGADVLIESFSPRVLPNLGYEASTLRRMNPRLVVTRIRAFGHRAPERSWVAYGRGVHAVSGLGMVDGVPQPALVAYPDPLAGFAAFGRTLWQLGAAPGSTAEVSLSGTLEPRGLQAGQPLGRIDDEAIARLRDATGGRPGAVILPARS